MRTVKLVSNLFGWWSSQNKKKLIYLTWLSTSALMTLPSADSDLLMFIASVSVLPSAPVLATFSLPAKSTKYSFPWSFFWVSRFSCRTVIMNIECDRELCSFMSWNNEWKILIPSIQMHEKTRQRPNNSLVTETWRLAFPSSMTSKTSSGVDTNRSVAPLT